LTERQETMGKLLKLAGRLDMVTSQMETVSLVEDEDAVVFEDDEAESIASEGDFSEDEEMIEE
jgi:hypothetical protein